MATKKCVVTMVGPTNSIRLAAWSGSNLLNNGDDGEPFQFIDWADRALQVSGTFGVGGTLLIEGSNDGTNWSTLSDLNGNSMSYTSATVKQINEAPVYVRPRVSAGDGSTALSVSIAARKVVSLL